MFENKLKCCILDLFLFLALFPNFVSLKLTFLVTMFDNHIQVLVKYAIFGIFN